MKEIKRKSEVTTLTDKEIQVFQMIADEKTRMEIAAHFGQSNRNVEAIIYKVAMKTGCKSPEGVLALLFRNKILK